MGWCWINELHEVHWLGTAYLLCFGVRCVLSSPSLLSSGSNSVCLGRVLSARGFLTPLVTPVFIGHCWKGLKGFKIVFTVRGQLLTNREDLEGSATPTKLF